MKVNISNTQYVFVNFLSFYHIFSFLSMTMQVKTYPHAHYDSVTEKFLENIHTMLNEPSVGLYRVQEHVRRSLPQLVEKKVS